MPKHIVSVGDLVLDVILPVSLPIYPAQHQAPTLRRIEPGGAGNFMIAARHMGLDVSAAGTVGTDLFGPAIIDPLRRAGIDTGCVVAVPGSTSTLVIVLTDHDTGEHVFIGHYGEGGEVPYPAGLDARIADADALFVAGYTLAEERLLAMATRALERAVETGTPIYLDIGPFLKLAPRDRVQWVLEHSAVVLATEDEVPLVGAADGVSFEAAADAAYAPLLTQGPEILVVKRGMYGCTIHTRAGWQQVPGFPAEVIDTVGPGDCFDAAFIAGLLRGLDLRQCGRLANAMGAAAVGRVGAGTHAPTCADVMAILDQAGEEIDFPC